MNRFIWGLERLRGAVHLPSAVIGPLFFYGRPLLFNFRRMLMQACVYEPALRYRCRSVGRNLRLMGPAPRISGSGTIDIGDNVQFGEGMSLLVGIGLPEQAHLEIKDNVRFTGHQEICVAQRVSIGNNSFIAGTIYDNDMHPTDPAERRRGWSVDPSKISSAPTILEDDVWMGLNAIVLKGVTVHRGAVIGAGAVVTEDVPALCVVAGNPARVVRQLSEPVLADDRSAAIAAAAHATPIGR